MELRVFVKQVLDDIDGALAEHLKERGRIATDEHDTRFGDVTFDVAVTTTDQQGSEGKAGIEILKTGLGGKLTSESTHEVVSRIQFTIQGKHRLKYRG